MMFIWCKKLSFKHYLIICTYELLKDDSCVGLKIFLQENLFSVNLMKYAYISTMSADTLFNSVV